MDTLAPIITDVFRLLCTDLYEHLNAAEFLANKTVECSRQDVDATRKLIPDLVVVIRGLWVEHEMTSDSDCRICQSAWPVQS